MRNNSDFAEDDLLLFGQPAGKPKKKKKGSSKQASFDFVKNLVLIGVDEVVASDWVRVRNKKKATSTQTAFEFTLRELEKIKAKYGVSYNDIITVCVIRDWMGCRASFFDNINFAEYGIDAKNQNNTNTNQNLPYYGKGYSETHVRTFSEKDEQNTVF